MQVFSIGKIQKSIFYISFYGFLFFFTKNNNNNFSRLINDSIFILLLNLNLKKSPPYLKLSDNPYSKYRHMNYNQYTAHSATTKVLSFNEGLRNYMLGIYNYMTVALMLSSVVAFFAARSGLAIAIFSSPIGILVSLAPLGISMYMGAKFNSLSVSGARTTLLLYAATMGLSLSTIFVVFNMADIFRAFFITASMFAGMSLYGYTTKKDLSSYASILFMGVWGVFIASLVNIFLRSSQLSFMVSIFSVVIFTVLTAYDVQKLKQSYYAVSHNQELATKFSIFGALQLYIDFVAIFVHLLNIMRAMRGGDDR